MRIFMDGAHGYVVTVCFHQFCSQLLLMSIDAAQYIPHRARFQIFIPPLL